MQYIVLFQQSCPQFAVIDAAGVGKGLKLPVLFKAPVVVQQTGGYGKPEIIFVRLSARAILAASDITRNE